MFKVAGVSKRNGQMKVRFANDMTRVKILLKTGSTDVELIELPKPMSKDQAVAYLKTTELYTLNAEAREAIDAADAKYNESPVVAVRKTSKKSAAEIKQMSAEFVMANLRNRAEQVDSSTQPAAEPAPF